MYTILEILDLSRAYLEKQGIEEPRRQAEELIGEALEIGRLHLYMEFDKPLTDEEVDKCREWLKRRGAGEPLQYICGKVSFFGSSIRVDRNVLIPRQETEILADIIAKTLKQQDLKGKVLWDVCCGSGCLGIALKMKFPELHVILSDISKEAIAVAVENAAFNGVKVEILEGDLLAPFNSTRANFVVCNPPYISERDYLKLEREVKDFEPKGALVAGDSGLEFYARLSSDLPEKLQKKAKVWFEIGQAQAAAISKLFSSPSWSVSKHMCDWSGKERFFFLEFE